MEKNASRFVGASATGALPIGAVAQLGERMTGSHEVRGSIPLGSTRKSQPGGLAFLFAQAVPRVRVVRVLNHQWGPVPSALGRD